MKRIKHEDLTKVFTALTDEYKVYAPTKVGKTTQFVPYSEGNELVLGHNTDLSPKSIFFPPMEKMYRYLNKGQEISIEENHLTAQKKIIFGIRSCDTKGLFLMDKVFLTRGFEDDFYKKRREETLLFAWSCGAPKDTCFCRSMGLNPQRAEGADMEVYKAPEHFVFEPMTKKGESFLKEHANLFEDCEGFTPKPVTQSLSVDIEGVSEKMEGQFENPLWQKLSRACIGCSTCAYTCPTCYCFDLTNKRHGEEGTKFRTWDCCMFDDYTLMAGGHNPRPGQKQRVRNRMMDKMVYNRKRYGEIFCVGCGRCIRKCPVNIDITEVIVKMKEGE